VYDAQNRLWQHYHKVDNNTEELLAENSYNELSQLTNKKVGNNLQSIDYTYNIRGWMTHINKDQMTLDNLGGKLFSYKIKYNQKEGIENPSSTQFPGKDVKAKYNGNIAEVDWRAVETLGVNPSSTPKRYGYAYDNLNRLTAGYYQNPNNPYSKENTESLAYDLNGNITNLYRTSVLENLSTTATLIDNLGYTYGTGGNLVTNINDISQNFAGYEGGGASIGYDLNGNMTTMPDKGISSIKYNFLNLPNNMMISKNGNENIIINTKYRADGTKLRKENTTDITGFNGSISTISITDYLDGFQYLKSVSLIPPGGGGFEMLAASALSRRAMEPQAFSLVGPVDTDPTIDPPFGGGGITVDVKTPDLQFFPTAEGFYDYQKNQYIYQYKDHLGNNRVSFARNSAGVLEITDANDYYPFGMNHLKTGNAYFGGSYKDYKYNGKELQETGMYDYGARFYMPDIGRWGVVDPLAEKMTRYSPYNYAWDNPIRFIDPDGMFATPPDDYLDVNGRYLGSDGAATKNVRVINRTDWNTISSDNGGSLSAPATQALQAASSVVTVNNTQINSDINNANNETIADQTKERQVFVGLEVTRGDVPTAEVTSMRGADGTDGKTSMSIDSRSDNSGNVIKQTFTGTSLIALTQVHTHNLTQEANKTNISGTSTIDKNTSNSYDIPIHAVDSYKGIQTNGNAIHRVMPNGVETKNISTTNSQNIGQDTLRMHVDKQKNP